MVNADWRFRRRSHQGRAWSDELLVGWRFPADRGHDIAAPGSCHGKRRPAASCLNPGTLDLAEIQLENHPDMKIVSSSINGDE